MSEKKSWQETLSELGASVNEGLDMARRVHERDMETAAGWPSSHAMIVQLREAVGLFAGALGISPMEAWEEALEEVRRLKRKEPT